MKMGRERAVEDTDILPLKEENTTQGLRDPYYRRQFDHILSHSSTTAFSLRSRRFLREFVEKVGTRAKKRNEREWEGREGKACPQSPRF